MSQVVLLFLAGALTILLPCILPLIPIVLGVSITGRSKLRPLLTIGGMLVSFVGFTFLLQVVLSQFVALADVIRLATFDILFLFGLGFLFSDKQYRLIGAALGGLFFWEKGVAAVLLASIAGVVLMMIGAKVATTLQQWGTDIQRKANQELGESPLTAFIVGLTMGLVWVPCAGPALGFAFTLVRDEPGLRALLLLTAYGLGTAIPLLIVGYGGQWAVHSVRTLSRYSGTIKQIAGALLLLTAIGLRLQWFITFDTFLIMNTSFGQLGTRLEEQLFGINEPADSEDESELPNLGPAPELQSDGPWHNSEPLTLAELRGKVVLIDFWTYSCINCIRTLPYLRGYWEKYGSTKPVLSGTEELTTGKDQPFVLIGVHAPEFVFEKSEANVRDAIARYELTYPIVQDNDFKTWRAFDNHYWPAKYLIDAQGNIRYMHFGEGAYEETDQAIASLLAEIGAAVTDEDVMDDATNLRREQTRETYIGPRSWDALGNARGSPSDDIVTYTAPTETDLHRYYLVGDWQVRDEERQALMSQRGEIRLRFLGSESNLVLGLEENAAPVQASVTIDGIPQDGFTIDRDDLYLLYKGDYGEHELVLTFDGAGVAAYAFTFGSN